MCRLLVACSLCCGAAAVLTACDDYLDELPDNRTEITNTEKVQKLLVSAYPTTDPLYVAEVMSDNVDNYGDENPNTSRFADQVYSWQDVTESNNQSPETFWETCYSAIATANVALQSIDEMGGAVTTELREARGEALLCRAYSHFMLACLFCQAWNSQTSATDLGLVYMDRPVQTLNENPERGNVADFYTKIQHDLEEALPLVGSNYKVPKYHFTKTAAYAFAARFYLFTEQWQKAADCATTCLGSEPSAMLRDWAYTASMTQDFSAVSQHYIDASLSCNLLLLTSYSYMGLAFGPYRYLSKYSHGQYLAQNEDGEAINIWGSDPFYCQMRTYTARNLDKTVFWKLPYLFEYYDAIAGTGYYRTVYPAFTADETLLTRAEAYTLLGRYDEAAGDLTTWMQNIVNTDMVLTPSLIQTFYNDVDYAYSDSLGIKSTIKKHLHPKFDIGQEGDIKETMLQCVLGFRRIETLQTGLRWYDIKRYGIEIVRRVINADGEPDQRTDLLRTDDPRRAIQIPLKARAAGVVPNPREVRSEE